MVNLLELSQVYHTVSSDGKPLTQARFVVKVKEALAAAGVDNSPYSGHSFRSGAATTVMELGVGDATIKMLGPVEK